jgi:hypothetical protein
MNKNKSLQKLFLLLCSIPAIILLQAGSVTAQEMDLNQGGNPIADGGSYDYSSHLLNTDTDVIFSIANTDAVTPLTLTALPIAIGGADAGQFSVQAQPTSPVAASGSTTFTVRFTPTSTGAKTATISIANSDADENPYDLTITGKGTLIIPTLSEWGMIILAILLAISAVMYIRRKKQTV